MKGQCASDGSKDQDLKKKIIDIDNQSSSLKMNLESFMKERKYKISSTNLNTLEETLSELNVQEVLAKDSYDNEIKNMIAKINAGSEANQVVVKKLSLT
jgi:hypothetical protein